MKKLILLLSISAILISMSSCNGEEKGTDIDSSQSVASSTDLSENQGSTELSGNQSSTQLPNVDLDKVNTEINKKRKNDDIESLKKISKEILLKHRDGINKLNFNECFDIYPDFYVEKVREDMKILETSELEYIKSYKEGITDIYGLDYEINITIDSILQLSDESLKGTNESINRVFDIDIKLEDAYIVNYLEIINGDKDLGRFEEEALLLKIKNHYYLYDFTYEQ